MYATYPQNNSREMIKAAVFSMFLLLFLAFSIYMACTNCGPVILGTEMNTNGMVEYMCLGSGCENLNGFSWSDK